VADRKTVCEPLGHDFSSKRFGNKLKQGGIV